MCMEFISWELKKLMPHIGSNGGEQRTVESGVEGFWRTQCVIIQPCGLLYLISPCFESDSPSLASVALWETNSLVPHLGTFQQLNPGDL